MDINALILSCWFCLCCLFQKLLDWWRLCLVSLFRRLWLLDLWGKCQSGRVDVLPVQWRRCGHRKSFYCHLCRHLLPHFTLLRQVWFPHSIPLFVCSVGAFCPSTCRLCAGPLWKDCGCVSRASRWRCASAASAGGASCRRWFGSWPPSSSPSSSPTSVGWYRWLEDWPPALSSFFQVNDWLFVFTQFVVRVVCHCCVRWSFPHWPDRFVFDASQVVRNGRQVFKVRHWFVLPSFSH